MKKSKYKPDDWVRGAGGISRYLGITRMTLYRWSKVVPLERKGGTNNYNKERFGNHTKSSLVKWAREVDTGHGKGNRYISEKLYELERELK